MSRPGPEPRSISPRRGPIAPTRACSSSRATDGLCTSRAAGLRCAPWATTGELRLRGWPTTAFPARTWGAGQHRDAGRRSHTQPAPSLAALDAAAPGAGAGPALGLRGRLVSIAEPGRWGPTDAGIQFRQTHILDNSGLVQPYGGMAWNVYGGVKLTWPIFEGLHTRGQVGEANAAARVVRPSATRRSSRCGWRCRRPRRPCARRAGGGDRGRRSADRHARAPAPGRRPLRAGVGSIIELSDAEVGAANAGAQRVVGRVRARDRARRAAPRARPPLSREEPRGPHPYPLPLRGRGQTVAVTRRVAVHPSAGPGGREARLCFGRFHDGRGFIS